MENTKIKVLRRASAVILAILYMSYAVAEEIIIQHEKITFEKCLKVINTSEDKLSVAPKIEKVSDLKRVAVFTLFDGNLTITCEGEEGTVTVTVTSN